ncbi:MAG: DNA translocase FtsK [Rikenellaceae bacterium]
MASKRGNNSKKKGASKGEVTANQTQGIDWYKVIAYCAAVAALCLSVMSIFSIIFYFWDWRSDYSIVMGNIADSHVLRHYQIANGCGIWGARIAQMLIGSSFGIFGFLVPLFFLYVSVGFLFKSYKVRFLRMASLMMLLLFMTSATLGVMFGQKWGLFNSGAGGAFGLIITTLFIDNVGVVGYVILLFFGWIATAISINRNFVQWVADNTKALLQSSMEVFENFKRASVSKNLLPQSTSQPSDEYDDSSDYYEDDQDTEEVVNEPIPFEDDEFNEFEIEDTTAKSSSDYQLQRVETSIFAEEVAGAEQSGDESIGITVESNELQMVDEDDVEQDLYDPLKDLYSYVPPPPSLLVDYSANCEVSESEILETKTQIEETLSHFRIAIQRIKATVGPTITLYEIVQAVGVKIAKITSLADDIAQSLRANGIRIIAPIPGRGTIGIEVPNKNKQVVSMFSSILSQQFQDMKAELPVVVGRTIQNECYVFDLAKMPHLLVAGATGQGKSVGLNAIITSLLYRKHPSQLKFVMIDPKMVEFSPYKNLENHFMARMESEDDVIITDPKKAVCALNALCEEMEKRLQLLSDAEVRNIVEYNEKFVNRKLNPENGHFYMPYIVTIIDEFADLIMMDRGVETPVMRLAQKARAIGIHLIVATQRPDVKVITGGIKANFPARIAFKVTSLVDSRTIIDQMGANQLIGRGDLLFMKDGELTRVQCALVETDEVSNIVKHISEQQGYTQPYLLPDFSPEGGGGAASDDMMGESGAPMKYDSMFAEAARVCVDNGKGSTSYLQKYFSIGFPRAGKIMMQLENAGIVARQVGPPSPKPREVYIKDAVSLEEKLQELGLS